MPVRAGPQLGFGRGELGPVVYALRLARVGDDHGADWVPGPGQHADDVREVVLALRVVGGEAAQRRAEKVAAERVDARAHLVDGQLLG